jgi:hypothetical protein
LPVLRTLSGRNCRTKPWRRESVPAKTVTTHQQPLVRRGSPDPAVFGIWFSAGLQTPPSSGPQVSSAWAPTQ